MPRWRPMNQIVFSGVRTPVKVQTHLECATAMATHSYGGDGGVAFKLH